MDEKPTRRNSLGAGLLALLAVAGSAVAVLIYQFSQREKPADIAGFDIAKTQENRPAAESGTQVPANAPAADRTMLQSGDLGNMRFGEGGGPTTTAQKANDNFTTACRKIEGKVQALAMAYTRRYPSIVRYGKDWMSYPDLKKLNDDYARDHDPVSFLRGTARSKNFAHIVVKYAKDPAVQSFVKEGIAQAPGEVTSSAMGLIREDNSIKAVVTNVVAALGLPPALTAGILGGGQVDQNKIMGQVLGNNPGLQGAMQDPNVQKAMQQGNVR